MHSIIQLSYVKAANQNSIDTLTHSRYCTVLEDDQFDNDKHDSAISG